MSNKTVLHIQDLSYTHTLSCNISTYIIFLPATVVNVERVRC